MEIATRRTEAQRNTARGQCGCPMRSPPQTPKPSIFCVFVVYGRDGERRRPPKPQPRPAIRYARFRCRWRFRSESQSGLCVGLLFYPFRVAAAKPASEELPADYLAMASLIFGVLGLVLRVRCCSSWGQIRDVRAWVLTSVSRTRFLLSLQYNVCAWAALVASLANIANTSRADMDVKQVGPLFCACASSIPRPGNRTVPLLLLSMA
jgi:hypothetical protein